MQNWFNIALDDYMLAITSSGERCYNLWYYCQVISRIIKGVFLVKDNRVLKGPLGRSLRSFARTAHSTHSLRSTPLRYAPFTGSLTHFAHSLVRQLKFLNMCSCFDRVAREQTRFWRSLETRLECEKGELAVGGFCL